MNPRAINIDGFTFCPRCAVVELDRVEYERINPTVLCPICSEGLLDATGWCGGCQGNGAVFAEMFPLCIYSATGGVGAGSEGGLNVNK